MRLRLPRVLGRWCLMGGVVVLAACAVPTTPQSVAVAPTVAPERATQIAADPELTNGEAVYLLRCAHCHGYSGEGQLPRTVQITQSLGLHSVPPHDATGHTWQHPDQLLLEVIQNGIQNPLDHFPMPAFASLIAEAEMRQVLAYIKLWWTAEQGAYQAKLTQDRAAFNEEFGVFEDNEE